MRSLGQVKPGEETSRIVELSNQQAIQMFKFEVIFFIAHLGYSLHFLKEETETTEVEALFKVTYKVK